MGGWVGKGDNSPFIRKDLVGGWVVSPALSSSLVRYLFRLAGFTPLSGWVGGWVGGSNTHLPGAPQATCRRSAVAVPTSDSLRTKAMCLNGRWAAHPLSWPGLGARHLIGPLFNPVGESGWVGEWVGR